MQHLDPLQKTPGIPLSRKLCYAIGGMPYQMTGNAKGFFMQIFLLDVVKVCINEQKMWVLADVINKYHIVYH